MCRTDIKWPHATSEMTYMVREPGVLSEAEIRKIEEDAFSDDDDLDTDAA